MRDTLKELFRVEPWAGLTAMRITKMILMACVVAMPGASWGEERPATDLPLVFEETFEQGRQRWETTDEKSWTHREVEGNHVFGINRRASDYKPEVRSPRHIALIKDLQVSDFVITFRVRSTKDTGNHRDCCVFLN